MQVGVIVHLSVDGLRVKNGRSARGFSENIRHLPFAETALEESVTTPVVMKSAPLPNFDEGYRPWRTAFEAGHGGFFATSIDEGISGHLLRREGVNP